MELADHRRIMLPVTIGDTDESIDQATVALGALVGPHRGSTGSAFRPVLPPPSALRTEQRTRPRDAFFAESVAVTLEEAVGGCSAEAVTPYPPGIPLLVPGEVVTAEIVDALDQHAAAGGVTVGAGDSTLRTFRVET
ncbi:MAG: ornithine decarboxylase [Acidimicrobiales bacterium]|nr:ornithine decarboxylase [Acidimicrobiales bacterium]